MARLEIFEVVEDVWCVRRGSSTAYVLKLSPGAVLVNAGSDAGGADVMMGLQGARVGLKSVRAILLMDAGVDAAAGAAALVERSGAPLHASSETAEKLRRAETPGLWGRLRGARTRPAVRVDRILQEGDVLFDRLEVVAQGNGRLALSYRPAGVLITGDGELTRRR